MLSNLPNYNSANLLSLPILGSEDQILNSEDFNLPNEESADLVNFNLPN